MAKHGGRAYQEDPRWKYTLQNGTVPNRSLAGCLQAFDLTGPEGEEHRRMKVNHPAAPNTSHLEYQTPGAR